MYIHVVFDIQRTKRHETIYSNQTNVERSWLRIPTIQTKKKIQFEMHLDKSKEIEIWLWNIQVLIDGPKIEQWTWKESDSNFSFWVNIS